MGNGVKNAADVFSSFKLVFNAKILVIYVTQEMSVWPQFGWEWTSVTKIWLGENVSDQNLAVNREKDRKAEYVQRRVCFVNVQSSLHENVSIFDVVFSIYLMSRPNLLFTASKSDLKHLR